MVHRAREAAERMQDRTCCRRSRYGGCRRGARRLAGCRIYSSAWFAACPTHRILPPTCTDWQPGSGRRQHRAAAYGACSIRLTALRRETHSICWTNCSGPHPHASRHAKRPFRAARPKNKKGGVAAPLCIQLLKAITARARISPASRFCFPASRPGMLLPPAGFGGDRRRRPDAHIYWLCRACCCAHRESDTARCAAICSGRPVPNSRGSQAGSV